MSQILQDDIIDCVDGIVYIENYLETNDGKIFQQLKAISIREFINEKLDEDAAQLIGIYLMYDMVNSFDDRFRKLKK